MKLMSDNKMEKKISTEALKKKNKNNVVNIF